MDHFIIAAYAYIELIAFHQPYPEHRWRMALDPCVTHGVRPSFE